LIIIHFVHHTFLTARMFSVSSKIDSLIYKNGIVLSIRYTMNKSQHKTALIERTRYDITVNIL